jgi:hypothetical protein
MTGEFFTGCGGKHKKELSQGNDCQGNEDILTRNDGEEPFMS